MKKDKKNMTLFQKVDKGLKIWFIANIVSAVVATVLVLLAVLPIIPAVAALSFPLGAIGGALAIGTYLSANQWIAVNQEYQGQLVNQENEKQSGIISSAGKDFQQEVNPQAAKAKEMTKKASKIKKQQAQAEDTTTK